MRSNRFLTFFLILISYQGCLMATTRAQDASVEDDNSILISVHLATGESTDDNIVYLTKKEFASLYKAANSIHRDFLYKKTGVKKISNAVFCKIMLNTLPFCYQLKSIDSCVTEDDFKQIYFDGMIIADANIRNSTLNSKLVNNKNFKAQTLNLYDAKLIKGSKKQLESLDRSKLNIDEYDIQCVSAEEYNLEPNQIQIDKNGFTFCIEHVLKPLEYKKVKLWTLSIARAQMNDNVDSERDNDIMKFMLDISSSKKHPSEFKEYEWVPCTVYLLNPEYTKQDENFPVKMQSMLGTTEHIESILLSEQYSIMFEKEYLPPMYLSDLPDIKLFYIESVEVVDDNPKWVLNRLKKFGYMNDHYGQLYLTRMVNSLSKNLTAITVYSDDDLNDIIQRFF